MKKSNYSLSEIITRLLKIAEPQKKMILLATVSSIIGNVARMTLMGCGAALILFSAGKLEGGSFIGWTVKFVLSALVIAVMRYVEGVSAHVEAYNLLANMRTKLFSDLRRIAPACLVEREKGDIISIAIADIDTIEKFFAHTIGPMFTVILLPAITIIYAGTIHRMFALTLIPVYLIISVIIPLIALKAGRQMGIEYRTELGSMKSLVLETVYGLKDIQIFGMGERRLKTIEKKSRQINRIAHSMTMYKQLVTAIPQFFIYTSRILIVFVAAYLNMKEDSSLNSIVILSAIVSASFSSTQSLISVVSSLLETFAAAGRLFEISDEKPAVVEKNGAVTKNRADTIEMDRVSFRYKEYSKDVLHDVSFTIQKGDMIGIVGESGSGKSTILRLLLRFWDPSAGVIRLDETKLDEMTFESLRQRIALVEQHTFIYDDTLANNIALGKPGAEMEEIRRAADRAGIGKRIERMPDGYNTKVGEFGNRLSGGERQRIGIARAMLTDPDIIIMDEPTSSLDIFNEKLILKTLMEEYADKTVILVSHRNSTLSGCNRIFRLEEGVLTEQRM